MVGRKWQGTDDGLGGTTVFVPNAPVDQSLRPFDDADDRRLSENGCNKAAKPSWDLSHPPQKPERAVRGPVLFPLLLCALATASRLPGVRETTGGEPVGWHGGRRQRREQTRDQVSVWAQGDDGIVHLAEYALLVGVQHNAIRPGIGTRQEVLAKYRLTKRG